MTHVLKPFHKQRYSVCRGCVNNCCKYNAIWVDLVAAERLAARQGLSLRRWASRYLANDPDLPYPEFRRRPCPFKGQLLHRLCRAPSYLSPLSLHPHD